MVSPLGYIPSLSHHLPHSLSSTRVRFGAKPASTAAPSRLRTNSMSQLASEANPDTSEFKTPDVLVQYVVLRRDLIDTWPLGSVVTQGCHASVSAIWSHKDDPHTLRYCSPENIDSMHKVKVQAFFVALCIHFWSILVNLGGQITQIFQFLGQCDAWKFESFKCCLLFLVQFLKGKCDSWQCWCLCNPDSF